ncbi:uncharacterized protein LOC129919218 [Episyrphus balteatus]|uniref:uncharacterized protein LOC129919218 n=1 Tax=Episyrphus balteatus TaxID=286459 RepID=UPI0024867BE3|nr:uncharacterized protein LOC129919218 [Episyrphus balteatus]
MLNIRNISPELEIKARDEINEVQTRITEDISQIRDWIKKQPHLTARIDDQFLLSFLRGCKYSLEKTKSKIDSYYTIRSLSPEIFLNKQINEKTMNLFKLGPFLPLLKPLSTDGCRIHLVRYGHIDFDIFSAEDLMKINVRILDIQLFEDDNVFIGGIQCVVDMSSLSLKKILKFDFVLIKKITIFFEKAAPYRIKGIHLINFPKECLYIINTLSSIMPKKIKKRFILHSSLESLYEYIPMKNLPQEYGGENGNLEDTILYWEKLFLQYEKFFEQDLKYGVNEKLRVGPIVSLESVFGLEGSFRKLEVDYNYKNEWCLRNCTKMAAKVRSLSAELQEIAISELNEDEQKIEDEINAIHHFVAGLPGMTKYQISDQFIISFLRSCKFNNRTVKKKLPNFMTMRKVCPDIFANRMVNEEMIEILKSSVHLPLPNPLDTNSSLIQISNYGNLNLKQYNIYEGIKLLFMMLEIRFLEDDHSSVAGFTFIEDFSHLSFSHMIAMNIGVLTKIMGYLRSGLPYRVKGIHIINAPWFVNGIMGLFRDILPLKMKRRFFIHKTLNDLYEHVPQKYLSKEYDGENGSSEDILKLWETKLLKYKNYFQYDFQFGTEVETSEKDV